MGRTSYFAGKKVPRRGEYTSYDVFCVAILHEGARGAVIDGNFIRGGWLGSAGHGTQAC